MRCVCRRVEEATYASLTLETGLRNP